MTDVKVDIIAVAHGYVDGHLCLIVDVVDGFAEHEEQGTSVGPETRGRRDVKKLHFLGAVYPVVHAFYLIIYMGQYGTVLHLESRQLINFFQCRPHRDVHFLCVVTT